MSRSTERPPLRAACAVLLAVALSAAATLAGAQEYPSRPITLIVPAPAGGGTDSTGRIVAAMLGERLGVSIVVQNVGGASGAIGVAAAARARRDGYTLLYTAQDFSILPLVRKETLYDVDRDFVPIAKVSEFPLVIASSPKFPAANLQQALELAKRQGTRLTYGTGGTGTLFHIVGEMLRQQSGVDLLHVPYRGGGPAQVGLLSGDTELLITALNISKNIQAGQFRGLAVTASKRSRFLPDVPSAPESGLPNLIALSWFVVFGPAGLPKPIVERLSEELTAMASSPQFREKCAQFGTEPAPLDYTELPKYLADYTASLKSTVEKANIRIGE